MSAIYKEYPDRGFGTEYTENFGWKESNRKIAAESRGAPGLLDSTTTTQSQAYSAYQTQAAATGEQSFMPPTRATTREFYSEQYPSIYRETVIHKDDRGKYIDPFKNIANKPYGRRLMYDPTHPDKMYPSQWSSELADSAGCYSFPTTTGLQAEQPWTKDMQWRMESEDGKWPTDLWKTWEANAECPPYDGHSDQPEYSQYKVQVP